ncbi:MAG TPA: DUF4142 domain-containing protein [Caulobacteraceae bacterium]|jgi:putative membrane protein
MRRILMSAAAIAAVASMAACNKADNTGAGGSVGSDSPGQAEPVNAAQDAMSAPVGMASAATLGRTTDGFVTNAAISDMYEIEAGKLAQQKGQNAQVKAFGAMMVKDHTTMSTKMKAALSKAGANVTAPTKLDERRQGMIDNLKAANGADFDTAYLAQQEAAHNEALTLVRTYAENGDNAALKAHASEGAPKIQQHLDKVKQLQDTSKKQG